MPQIRCPKCGQAYDIPGVIAVRLPSSIATCHCGGWLSGSKAAVLARLVDVDQIREIDLKPYRVDAARQAAPAAHPEPSIAPPAMAPDVPEVVNEPAVTAKPNMRTTEPAAVARVVLICVEGPLAGQEFEIPPGGLVVGREGHVRVPDEFLSRRHFEVAREEDGHVRVRDLGSRNGTFLNTLPARNTKVHTGDEIRAGVNRFKIEHRA
jgi:hypothetical protein